MVVRHADGTFARTLTDVGTWARVAFNTRTEDKAPGQNPRIDGTITSSRSTFPRYCSSGEGGNGKDCTAPIIGTLHRRRPLYLSRQADLPRDAHSGGRCARTGRCWSSVGDDY